MSTNEPAAAMDPAEAERLARLAARSRMARTEVYRVLLAELERTRAALEVAARALDFLASGQCLTEWSRGAEREPEARRQYARAAADTARKLARPDAVLTNPDQPST